MAGTYIHNGVHHPHGLHHLYPHLLLWLDRAEAPGAWLEDDGMCSRCRAWGPHYLQPASIEWLPSLEYVCCRLDETSLFHQCVERAVRRYWDRHSLQTLRDR